MDIEERASNAYYACLKPVVRKKLMKQELTGPILMKE